MARRRVEARQVIHHAFLAGDRRLLHHEIRELDLQVRRGRLELRLHGVENVGDVLDVDDVAVRVEHLEEAAHVRAFELLGQVHEHADGRHRVLHRARLVPHLDREAQTPHADLVDAQLPVVALALLVVQFGRGRWRGRRRFRRATPTRCPG